jgi:hypothetical protein
MDAQKFVNELREVLAETDDASDGINQQTIRRIETFEEAGILTRDAGLIVMMTDGSEFQVTVVRSRPARR